MIDLSLFRFSHPVEVRYADIDALQHVNNACYFTYMETARARYFRSVLGWNGLMQELGIILARAACDYLLPIQYGDLVRVYVRTARLGGKSFDFEYALVCESCEPDGSAPRIAAAGTSVQVAYDYRAGQSIPVPDAWREKMIAYEPGLREA
jgi:acyl-CoA thioester hydrolase